MFDAATKLRNETIIEQLMSKDAGMTKQAEDKLNDYIRIKEREAVVVDAILPPFDITAADLDVQLGFEEPVKIFEREPATTAAITVPFGGNVEAREIEGSKFPVVFDTIRTLKKRANKFKLMTYRNDIRNIITDNDINEIGIQKDVRFFALCDSLLGGAAGTSLSAAGGVAMWQSIAGGLTPETWVDMMQIMPKGLGNFSVATVVMNLVRAEEFFSWNADDLGDAMKAEVLVNGWSQRQVGGRKIIVTIKRNIVGDNDVYMFAEPNKLGKHCRLQAATIYPKVEADMLEWHCLESVGLTLAQVTGIAKATLTG